MNNKAEKLATSGKYTEAIEKYLKIVRIDRRNGPAWTALGHCYLL